MSEIGYSAVLNSIFRMSNR